MYTSCYFASYKNYINKAFVKAHIKIFPTNNHRQVITIDNFITNFIESF